MLSWRAAEPQVWGWQLQPPQREVSEEGYNWRWKRNPSRLLLVFSLPLSTNFHCASPASIEKGNLEETAYAFCSKVLPFLLHSLDFSRSSSKSVRQSCDTLHCFFVSDSKTHKKSWQLYRCVSAIISAANILNSEYSWKELMAAIASTGIPQTPHQALGLPDPMAWWCQTPQFYPSHRPHKKSFRAELTSHSLVISIKDKIVLQVKTIKLISLSLRKVFIHKKQGEPHQVGRLPGTTEKCTNLM